LQATRTIMFGLFGLNRQKVETLVAKKLEEEGATFRGDTGVKIPILQFVKSMTLEKLMKQFERILKEKPSEKTQ